MENYLIVLNGPTSTGKTETAIEISKILNTNIISCDSRQFYRELVIGTAQPEKEQLNEIKHYFIGNKSIFDYYNVSMFESEVIQTLDTIYKSQKIALMVGGSGLYSEAVCKGIDDIPDIDFEIRDALVKRLEDEGLESLRFELKKLDPVYYSEVDLKNKKRILRALEVCIGSGRPFSSFRTKRNKTRAFKIIKIGLKTEKEILYNRINIRVDKMIEAGLIEEAKRFYDYRHLNTLNTVGYKELFDYFDGSADLEQAIRLIKRNTRRFAKRQLTWFLKDKDIKWFEPGETDKIIEYINKCIQDNSKSE